MAVMGEASAEVWAEELHRTGRVVFPQRPRAFVFKIVILAWLCLSTARSFPSMQEAGGFVRILGFLLAMGTIGCLGYLGWQAVTGRPVLIVDRLGIRSGRKFMPWTDIGTIGIPHGPRFARTLPILPDDVWAKGLTLSQDNVRDVFAFAHWLEAVLKEQRLPGNALRLPPGRNDG